MEFSRPLSGDSVSVELHRGYRTSYRRGTRFTAQLGVSPAHPHQLDLKVNQLPSVSETSVFVSLCLWRPYCYCIEPNFFKAHNFGSLKHLVEISVTDQGFSLWKYSKFSQKYICASKIWHRLSVIVHQVSCHCRRWSRRALEWNSLYWCQLTSQWAGIAWW